MNSENSKEFNEQLEAFLDGQFTDSEEKDFRTLNDQAQLSEEMKLQSQIDNSLRKQFTFDKAEWRKHLNHPNTNAVGSGWSGPRIVWLTVAASLFLLAATIVVVTRNGNDRGFEFQQRPLAQLYDESVDRGFQPYYECEDLDRFAQVFAKRQGVELSLSTMPVEKRMLGLSYLGGFTSDSTAVLCEVGQAKVIVFVDRLEHDNEANAYRKQPGSTLNIFRVVRRDLVFYEVTPLNSGEMIEHFVFPDDD